MLGKKKYEPKIMYNLTLDELVPEDNLYRQIVILPLKSRY